LRVEELVVPEAPSRDAAFAVTLTVVTGGCRSFDRIDGKRSTGRLVLTAIGRDNGGQLCPADVRFEKWSYTVAPPFDAQFAVVARQPDATEIVREIRFD